MIEKLKKLLKKAVERCYYDDKFLIEQNMERPAVARIFYYMQNLIDYDEEFSEFREYNLDVEYNKKGRGQKVTDNRENGSAPDIILHIRQENVNLLVVEFKSHKNYKKTTDDRLKLIDFTKLGQGYEYKLGVFVKLYYKGPKLSYYEGNNNQEEQIIISN